MPKNVLAVGPLEFEVIGLLSQNGEQSVAQIRDGLENKGQELAYTTVMTVLSRLFQKDLVIRRKDGRQFLYSVAHKQKDSSPRIFEKLFKSLFGADRLKPILALLDSQESLSKEELRQLRKAIDEKLKGQA